MHLADASDVLTLNSLQIFTCAPTSGANPGLIVTSKISCITPGDAASAAFFTSLAGIGVLGRGVLAFSDFSPKSQAEPLIGGSQTAPFRQGVTPGGTSVFFGGGGATGMCGRNVPGGRFTFFFGSSVCRERRPALCWSVWASS